MCLDVSMLRTTRSLVIDQHEQAKISNHLTSVFSRSQKVKTFEWNVTFSDRLICIAVSSSYEQLVVATAAATTPTVELVSPTTHDTCSHSRTHHMKSLQWEQNVGCLKKRGINRWSLMLQTFFFFKAPLRPRLRKPSLLSFWSSE